MGGKGKKRREKNYRAAHGDDNTRLPPPPVPSSIDALPSKLRRLMAFASKVDDEQKGKGTDNGRRKPLSESDMNTKKRGRMDGEDVDTALQNTNNEDGNVHDGADQKKGRKRKKAPLDQRFAAEMEKLGVRSSRRERKKEHLKAKKEKKKQKRAGPVPEQDAPKKDHVKFGEVVQAPPKLAVVPKAPKKAMDASQERLRLQAVEAYRSRKQWTSRLGVNLPLPVADSSASL